MELFKLLGSISIDNEKANQEIDDTTNKAKDGEKQQSGAFKKIGGAATTMAKGMVGVGAALGGAFIVATEGTREYRVAMGKLEAAFATSGHSAGTAQKTYNELNAVLGDSDVTTEAAQQLAMLTDNQKDLDTMTNVLTGVFATFGDALPVEGLAEAANHTAKVGEVQGSLADALEWSGVSVESFNTDLAKCNTEQERQQLITSTLNSLYGDAATKYKEVNKDVIEAEKAQGRLTEAFAKIGGVLEPAMTAMKNGLSGVIESALPFIQSFSEKIPSAIESVKGSFSIFVPYLQQIWSFLWSVLKTTWATVGKPIFDFIKQAVSQLLNYWNQNWPAASNVIRDVFGIIKNLWNSVLKPVLQILGDYVRNTLLPIWKTAFNGIMKVVQTVFNGIIKLWNGSLKPILNGIIQFVSGVLTGNWRKAWEGIKNIVSGIFSGIRTVISTSISTIKSIFSSGLSVLTTTARTIFNNVKNAISEKLNGAVSVVKTAINKIKDFFNITLKFNGLKMPNIKLTMQKGSGLMAKAAELLGMDGVPKFSVTWNAKGGILTQPTIFGLGKNGFLGGGEAGAEAIAPIDTLQSYVSDSVNSRNADIISAFEIQISRLISFLKANLPTEYKIALDSGVLVGEMAGQMDSQLADRYEKLKRGNTR